MNTTDSEELIGEEGEDDVANVLTANLIEAHELKLLKMLTLDGESKTVDSKLVVRKSNQ